jgi:hypothetical protein
MIAASRRVSVIAHPPSIMRHSTKTRQSRRLSVGSYPANGRLPEPILEGRVQSTRSRRCPLNGPYLRKPGLADRPGQDNEAERGRSQSQSALGVLHRISESMWTLALIEKGFLTPPRANS